MQLPHMGPLSWFAKTSNVELWLDLFLLGGFIVVIVGGWLVYKATTKKIVCKECGEVIKTHLDIQNCPVCGSLLLRS